MGMRLLKHDLRTVEIYRPAKTQSGYVGTVETQTLIGTVQAVIAPVTDEYSARIYGERVLKMKEFTLLTPADIRYGDRLVTGGEKYKVIAKPEYSDHITVKGELV